MDTCFSRISLRKLNILCNRFCLFIWSPGRVFDQTEGKNLMTLSICSTFYLLCSVYLSALNKTPSPPTGSCKYELCPMIENMADTICTSFPPSQPCGCPLLKGDLNLQGRRNIYNLNNFIEVILHYFFLQII